MILIAHQLGHAVSWIAGVVQDLEVSSGDFPILDLCVMDKPILDIVLLDTPQLDLSLFDRET